MQIAV